MGRVAAYHGKNRDVYHNHSDCWDGNNIEKRNLVKGTGGKKQCSTCANLFKK